jgi:GR25 family glycosyltransferase involved in LPS biosynthesis
MFNIFNERFDKVFVINLKRHTDRRAYINKHFEGLDFNYEFFDAVDGSTLSEEVLETVYDKEGTKKDRSSKGTLSTSEIGCAMSHLMIYEKARMQNLDKILILEDDARISKEYYETISGGLKELPADWDLLYFGVRPYGYDKFMKLKALTYYPLKKMMDPGFEMYDAKQLLRFKPRRFSTNLEKAGFHYGSHAYAITKKAYAEVLDKHMPLTTVFDCILPKLCISGDFNAFKFKENVIDFNDEFESSIQYISEK